LELVPDKRADIWAFGVVLYEMLTGKELFAGETVSDILAAVIKKKNRIGRRFRRKCARYCAAASS